MFFCEQTEKCLKNNFILIFTFSIILLLCLGTVSASENVTDDVVSIQDDVAVDDVVSVQDDVAVDEVVSEIDSKEKSITVQNDDDSSSLLTEGELKDPGLNLTVVRNGVIVSFNEENVTGIIIYGGDDQMSKGEFFNYTGAPYFIDLNGFEVDDYPVAVNYFGNDIFKSAYDFVVVSVERNGPGINATLNGTEITVTFTDENATMLEVRADIWLNEDEMTTITHFYEDEPLVIDDFSYLTPGQYAVDVYFPGDDYYTGTEKIRFTVTVPEKPTVDKKSSEFSNIIIEDGLTLNIIIKDSDGNVIANAPIAYAVNGNQTNTTADANGKFTIVGENGAVITINYAGNENITGTNITLTLINHVVPTVKLASQFNIAGGVITIKGYAVDTKANEKGVYYATELLDAYGKPIKGAKIQFAVNGKIYNRTTNENGSFAPFKFNTVRSGRYTMAFYFAGNDNYTGAFASVCVVLDKKPIKIKASNKSYKASAKTKTYTVTLSTAACSSQDGKAHLKSGLKVNLAVHGKIYTCKTNSKGEVTFKITNLNKKAKYKARISYAGDNTYKLASKAVTLTVK